MRMYDIISKKQNNIELTEAEIRWMISEYTAGTIPDYQMSAFAMAVYFNGMTKHETAVLTDAMANSGDTLDLSRYGDRSVDKHSTGGIGDKTTIVVAPVVASLGGIVAKMTGRGLGHTGGTADKLESIPGFNIILSEESFLRQVDEIGIAVTAQSGNLAPADKKLYALRDVTATVESTPLIASSIMSKKLASGAHSIVLDVKVGSGSFNKTPEIAVDLAKTMIEIGTSCGRNVTAVLTDMNLPLGKNIGNSLEVQEAIDVLKGSGPSDLKTVCVELASNMLVLSNKWDIDHAREQVNKAIKSGSALQKFREWITAQGGNAECIDDYSLFPNSSVKYEVRAAKTGYISDMNAEKLGLISVALGAGREKKEDNIDFSAGIVLEKKLGDYVNENDVIAVLHTSSLDKAVAAEKTLLEITVISDKKTDIPPLIYSVLK